VVKDEGGPITTLPFCEQGNWLSDLICFGAVGFRVPAEPFHCRDFSVCLPDDVGAPQPGIAIWQNPAGGAPSVVVSDGKLDTVGYTFDPARGFAESFRVHDTRRTTAAGPMVLPDGHSVVGTTDHFGTDQDRKQGRVTFAGPNTVALSDINENPDFFPGIDASPSQLADGRLVVVGRYDRYLTLSGRASVLARLGNQAQSVGIHFDGESVAPAAASCSYFYIASTGAFTTFDLRTLRAVAAVPWYGGGRSPPAIGPGGHVYAVASSAMFVFPPARAVTNVGTACGAGENNGGLLTPESR
jgi:hypothetical protein